MADARISDLSTGVPTSTDLLPFTNGTTTKASTVANLLKAQQTVSNWTPSWTNLSIGNGTQTAEYVRVGNIVLAYISLTFGSTTSVSGNIIVSLPVNNPQEVFNIVVGNAIITDASPAGLYTGILTYQGSDVCVVRCVDSSGSYSQYIACTASVPITFTTDDILRLKFVYFV